jgi:phage tail tape-measure protein
LSESVTCTVNCEVVALLGTALAESTPKSERANHAGSPGDITFQWKGADPVPATVRKVTVKLPPMLAAGIEGAVIATCGFTVRVND